MRAASKSRRTATILVRLALWFCVGNLLAAVVSAQCPNATQVPTGTYTTGDHSASDNNALAAANVVLSGSATATFVAGNCIDLQPGFHATAGTAATTFHAWVETAPSVGPASPPNGTGLSQTFTWTVSSPAGFSNLSDVMGLFNTSLSFPNACYIRYNRTSNLLYLADNPGLNWLGGIVPGSASSVSNSQCTINGSGSSYSPSGTQLTVKVVVTFQTSFAGTKNHYLVATDIEGLNSSWQPVGTWTVGNPTSQQYSLTTAVSPSGTGSITPSCPSGCVYSSGSQVQITATPAAGYQFTGFSGSLAGGSPGSVTMNSNKSVTANFAQTAITQTVTSSPTGRSLTVDGFGCTVPCTFQWASGSAHTIAATTQSGGTGVQYAFANWSDGGAASHTVTAPSTSATYTANFTTQYFLTTAAGTGGAISPASGFYNAGNVTISATANSGYAFSSFTGTYTGSTNPLTVNLSSAGTINANFVAGYTISGQVTLSGSGTGLSGASITVSGSQTGSTTTDASGRYALPALAAGGSYTVTGFRSGYAFSAALTFPNLGANQTAGFTATPGLTIVTTALPSANLGAPYSVTLAASAGAPPYTWSLAAGSSLPSGLTLNSSSGALAGNPAATGTFQFTVKATDTAGATATQPLSLAVVLPTLSINGGSNSAEVGPSTNVSLAFNLYDQADGANGIAYGQFYLADSTGNANCYGDWGRPNALDLYDGNTGTTTGFGINQSDSFCNVSLTSITNSASDPTEVTVVLNFNFNPGPGGTYAVMTQINYASGYQGPWENVGTLIIDPAREPMTGPPLGEAAPQSAPMLAPPPPVSVSVNACSDISGIWADPNTQPSAEWSLSQTASNIAGSLTYSSTGGGACSSPVTVQWNVTGTTNGNSAHLDATSPNPASFICGNYLVQEPTTISVDLNPDCTTAAVTNWTSTYPPPPPTSPGMADPQLASPQIYNSFTRSGPAVINLVTNLYSDCISVIVTGENTQSGSLSVSLNGPASPVFQKSGAPGCFAGPTQGTVAYYGFGRTSLKSGQYTGVTAAWNTTSVTTPAGSPTGFYVIGLTRFSQYNTPYASDSSCQGTLQDATIIYKIDRTDCWYEDVKLPSVFMNQVTGNGTGVYNNMVLKGYNAGAGRTCPLWGNGFTAANTFYSVDSGGHPLTTVVGANWRQGYVLSDGTGYPSTFNLGNPPPGTVATDANITPQSSTPGFQYGDAILLFDQSNNNDARGLRSVQDLCPACKGDFGPPRWGSTVAHIDMYNGTSQLCSLNNDYGQYYAIRLR